MRPCYRRLPGHSRWLFLLLLVASGIGCSAPPAPAWTEAEKAQLRQTIESRLAAGLAATRAKDIDAYMAQLPTDLVIYDESGDIVSREQQRANALRDWSIIDTTLAISELIDSIDFASQDSLLVYTAQRWERLMFRRDGVTTDTVLTTQRHRETWKQNPAGWFGYTVEELGGEVFINGERYVPE